MAEQQVVTELALGKVTVHGEVLTATVNKALGKVEGARPARKAGGVRAIFGGGEESVQLKIQGDTVDVEARVDVVLGYPAQDVSRAVQQAVRDDLERLGCARVGTVNVSIKSLITPEEKPASGGVEEGNG